MTITRVDTTDRELVQVKIFTARLDSLQGLEQEINNWLKENRDLRPDRIQLKTAEGHAVVMVAYAATTRGSRGVGFGEAVQTARS